MFAKGKLLGKFDEMYQYSKNIPWHQDVSAQKTFVDIELTFLRFFLPKFRITSLCDLGCGMGYVTARLKNELPLSKKVKIIGFDISSNAVTKAKKLFPSIEFKKFDIMKDSLRDHPKFDFVYVKDIFWYVAHDVNIFINQIKKILKKDGGIYCFQSVPDKASYVGSKKFPSTLSIAKVFAKNFDPLYISSTFELMQIKKNKGFKKDKYLRF